MQLLCILMKQNDASPRIDPGLFFLRLTGSLTFGQIGEIMGKSENWARVTFYRGKERIVKEAKENETEHTL